jgi:hypothetical protein
MRFIASLTRLVPILMGSVAGILVAWSLVQTGQQPARLVGDTLLQIAQIITAVGLFFGLLNVLALHAGRLAVRARGWPQSVVIVIAAAAVFALEMIAGTAPGIVGVDLSPWAADVFRYVYQPLATSILGLLTFFALRASWRALYARPVEALLILVVAVVFLIASGPWSAALPGLQATLDWIRSYPALGVARGLLLGVGIGALVASVRLLLGFDRPYLDR